MNRSLLFLVVGLIGLAIGWLVGAPRDSGSSDASAGARSSNKTSPRNSSRTTPVTLGSGRAYSDAATTLTTLFARDDEALVREFTRLQQIPHSAPGRPLDELLLYSIAFELGRRSDDPAAMIDALQEATPSPSARSIYASMGILNGWAWRDPESASRFVLESGGHLNRGNVLSILGERDLERGLELIASIPDENRRSRALAEILQGMARRNPARAIEEALQYADPRQYIEDGIGRLIFQSTLNGLAPDELGMVVRSIEAAVATGEPISSEVLADTLEALAQHDPETAADLFLRNVGLPGLNPDGFLQRWAQDDPTAALDWAQAHLDDAGRDRAVRRCLQRWIRAQPLASWEALNDPQSPYHGLATTEEWINDAGAGFEGSARYGQADPARVQLIRSILAGESDLPLDFAFKLANGDIPVALQSEVMARLVAEPELDAGGAAYRLRSEDLPSSTRLNTWARGAPETAVALFHDLTPDQAERALFSIAAGVAEVYPSRAAELVTAQPASTARDFAIQVVAAHWAQQDPRAALHWAHSLPPGPARDLAIRNAITQGSPFNPTLEEPD